MSEMIGAVGTIGGSVRVGEAAPAGLGAAVGKARTLVARFRALLLARRTRRILDGLDEHIRRDVGLGPRSDAPPRLPPSLYAWLR
jgi:uncharacterized protein YjiS (DUF1127 family)